MNQDEITKFDEFVKITQPKLKYILFEIGGVGSFTAMNKVAVYDDLEKAKEGIKNHKENNIGTRNTYYLVPSYEFFM